jgi:peptidoglycan/xylan/chitin deacetylase (PgdA/CDA1 family)
LRSGEPALPTRPIVITFDDGYADFHAEALPILDQFGFAATLFVTTGWLHDAGRHAAGRPLDRMLTWSQVKEVGAHGIELAGHSHSHPQLDQIDDAALREELSCNKKLLENETDMPVTTMAYPYGYSTARVRRAAAAAGYEAACAVNNALVARHDRFAMPRLTVGRDTTMTKFQAVVAGQGVPALYLKERALTKGYSVVRRTRSALRTATSGFAHGRRSS